MSRSTIPFPLFHGTSSLFLASIREKGLGGLDPVASRNGLECLRYLHPLGDRYLAETDWWVLNRDPLRYMCEQSVGGYNFRHGAVYLTPWEETAVKYALSNRYGSELLSNCIELCEHLTNARVPEIAVARSRFPDVWGLARCAQPQPVLIRVDNVLVRDVVSEKGEDPADTIARILDLMAKSWQCVMAQMNFELIRPIPSDRLTLSSITKQGGGQFDPKYTLQAIDEEVT